jgi:hypothetical protein
MILADIRDSNLEFFVGYGEKSIFFKLLWKSLWSTSVSYDYLLLLAKNCDWNGFISQFS